MLWGAARKAMAFWPGALLVSALFGSVHVLNAFITGHIGEAGIQAVNAFLSGFAYLALRIRTRSLFPIMVAHGLWDLAVFLAAANGGEGSQAEPATRLLFGVALVAPIAFYGLWLLRKREFHIVTDDLLAARDGAGPGATNPTRAAQS